MLRKLFVFALIVGGLAPAAPSRAAPVAFASGLRIGAGSFGGLGAGGLGSVGFTFDSSLLTGGAGFEFPAAGLSGFVLTIGSFTLLASGDPSYPSSPLASFDGGGVSTISASFPTGNFTYANGALPSFVLTDLSGAVVASGQPVPAPEPMSLAVLALAAVALAAIRRPGSSTRADRTASAAA